MGTQLLNTSSQRWRNASPLLTDMPLSVGFWFRPVTSDWRAIWSLWNNTTTTTNFVIYQNPTPELFINAQPGGTAGTIAYAIAAGSWTYVVGRWISTTNVRMAAYSRSERKHTAMTGTYTGSGLNVLNLGCDEKSSGSAGFFNGQIAEYWMASGDIQADGGQLRDDKLLRLAHGGPFADPETASKLIEYRSFFNGNTAHNVGDYVSPKYKAFQPWENTNGCISDRHPEIYPTEIWRARKPVFHPSSGIWRVDQVAASAFLARQGLTVQQAVNRASTF